jgi:hypothetical protein
MGNVDGKDAVVGAAGIDSSVSMPTSVTTVISSGRAWGMKPSLIFKATSGDLRVFM